MDPDYQQYGNYLCPLIVACERGHIEIAKMLLNWGAAVHQYKASAFDAAVKCEDIEMVKLILKYGTSKYDHLDGATMGSLQVASHLLRNGLSVVNPKTPVHLYNNLVSAVSYCSADVVRLILRHGAEYSEPLNKIRKGSAEIEQLLIEYNNTEETKLDIGSLSI
eukprot:TRINITY_DN5058_c0_g1_i1.p1 TRINITY_DN5058_c0_g1~~TRINITY_DN5058_c0_g1_i1.p1  ORF type:complete len:164 (-),score=37.51 TRINITY_DN5058_c0_g1_i1:241-732(-)